MALVRPDIKYNGHLQVPAQLLCAHVVTAAPA
eukprot:COSAG03_NODE_1802_length_3489_cov_9.689676_4_plen_32_part_00